MSRLSKRKWYAKVNACWPERIPPLTEAEAIRAAKRLYRYAFKRTWRGPIVLTSGNRYARFQYRQGKYTMLVNPDRGWHHLVHMLSHAAVRGAHGAEHARMERRMILEVVRRGWLDGKLKDVERPAPDPVDPMLLKRTRLEARLKRWESKQRRAETAIRKLRRQLARTLVRREVAQNAAA